MTRKLSFLLSGLLAAPLFGAGCTSPQDVEADRDALTGKDGDLVVTMPGSVLNRYALLNLDAATGDRSLRLRSVAPLMPLEKGDLLLIVQMQGASIDTSDSAGYGAVTALNNAGHYELVTVESVKENDEVFFDSGCRLRQSYSADGITQVIRVPQLRTLRVTAGASIVAPPWNGQVGGVVAVHVQETAQIDGAIDVTGRGFRGGQADNLSTDNDGTNVIWRSTDPARGGEKGEGIAGVQASGRYGRGAPANGGGGGNSHNAGGGGGANGNNAAAWSGMGVMDGTVIGAAAWTLDPAYAAAGNKLTASSGGGRGGYSFAQAPMGMPPSPLVLAPGSMNWGGDWRRAVGGLGGRPLENDPRSRLFLGGGGGAGDGNDGAASGGGNGGGMVVLLGGAVSGAGAINADGQSAQPTGAMRNDAAGGGGAGGTVVVAARSLTGVRISASGGRGGDQPNSAKLTSNRESEGPGGGGGGGYIAVSGGNVTTAASGAAGGTSQAPIVMAFPANGATRGAPGQALEALMPNAVPICFGGPVTPPDMSTGPAGGSDLSVKITASPTPTVPDQPETYTISVSNKGPDAAKEVSVTFTVPEGGRVLGIEPGEGWTCVQKERVITCTRDEVAPGSAPDTVIKVAFPTDSTTPVTAEGTVTSATPDPSPADNKTSVTTARGGYSLAGGGLTCSFGGRGGAAQGGAAALGLAALLLGLSRRRRKA